MFEGECFLKEVPVIKLHNPNFTIPILPPPLIEPKTKDRAESPAKNKRSDSPESPSKKKEPLRDSKASKAEILPPSPDKSKKEEGKKQNKTDPAKKDTIAKAETTEKVKKEAKPE